MNKITTVPTSIILRGTEMLLALLAWLEYSSILLSHRLEVTSRLGRICFHCQITSPSSARTVRLAVHLETVQNGGDTGISRVGLTTFRNGVAVRAVHRRRVHEPHINNGKGILRASHAVSRHSDRLGASDERGLSITLGVTSLRCSILVVESKNIMTEWIGDVKGDSVIVLAEDSDGVEGPLSRNIIHQNYIVGALQGRRSPSGRASRANGSGRRKLISSDGSRRGRLRSGACSGSRSQTRRG